MKSRLCLLFLFIPYISVAQIIVTGRVMHKKMPLEGAAVYFNNTMVGTTTDQEGVFSFSVKEGNYELIVSYLGFKTINYSLTTSNYKEPLFFSLFEEESQLDEIVIKKIRYDDEWKYNFYRFRKDFIGTTKLSKGCKILNPKVLYFETNANNTVINAFARKPLKLKHTSLGYTITFDLIGFTIHRNMVSYRGYSRYEELVGSKKKEKRWKKNRLKAYKGSPKHFFKSVADNNLKKQGFKVDQFRRVENRERPSEFEIKEAKNILRTHRNAIDFSKKITKPKNVLDSALFILRKRKLPKFKDYFYKSNFTESDLLKIKNDSTYLSFDNNLSIVYKKERAERGYVKKKRSSFVRASSFFPQTSYLFPLKKPIHLNKKGNLTNPLSVYYVGYWSYEKFADTLPLDYTPTK
jgi:hypothetical protein